MNPTVSIQAYSLLDFTLAVQDAVKQGYEVSVDNEHYPNQLGVLYVATLVNPAANAAQEKEAAEYKLEEVPAEEQVAPKRKTKQAV